MIKRLWAVLVIAWVLTLVATWNLGHMEGERDHRSVEAANRHAQVECLKAMWGRPLTLTQLEEVKNLEHDPEAVRAYLLDTAITERNSWKTVPPIRDDRPRKLQLPVGGTIMVYRAPWEELSPNYFFHQRAVKLLTLWRPGQSDIQKTANDPYAVSSLWNVYLTNPIEAWNRGVSGNGEGGK